MAKILVSGLINIETTLQVDGFPIHYNPVNFPFFGVNSTVSGVGYNVARALTTLGDTVSFLSLIGQDASGELARSALQVHAIDGQYVLAELAQTPQSVILYDRQGRRQINVDLKDIQERAYPPELFTRAAAGCEWAALCNINFSRPFLKAAQQAGLQIATDVHTITDADDGYNRDFMQAADVLFMSDELLPVPAEEWVRCLWARYRAEIVVIGLGSQGALLAVRRDHIIRRFPAASTRPLVNTIGAGDALFSAFLHGYARSGDPYQSLHNALVFASYKIGVSGAAEGFLDDASLEQLAKQVE